MTVLLSIKPEYAERIFDGSKRFEFRRSIFKKHVERVIVYASSPMRRIIGEFNVEGVIYEEIETLWRTTSHAAGISEERFYGYFAARGKGYAIVVGTVLRYDEPVPLEQLCCIRPPQSFRYMASRPALGGR